MSSKQTAQTVAPLIDTKLTAVLHAGSEKLEATVAVYYGSKLRLRISRTRRNTQPPTLVSDFQVTLYRRDGSAVQPPLVDPGAQYLIGAENMSTVFEGVSYDLTGLNLEGLNAVQVVFRKQPSARTSFQAP